jgi:hypothetical protein
VSLHAVLEHCSASHLEGCTDVCEYRSLLAEILMYQLLDCVDGQYLRSVMVGTFHWDLWPGAWCIPGYDTEVPDVGATGCFRLILASVRAHIMNSSSAPPSAVTSWYRFSLP